MHRLRIYLALLLALFGAAIIPTSAHRAPVTTLDVETHEQAQMIEKPNLEPLTQLTKQYGGSDCATELMKYGWNHEVAYNVMMVESGGNARALNNNYSTGDYSVGCFQMNLLGGNLTSKYRIALQHGYTGQLTLAEVEDWYKVASNNVAAAYSLYQRSGWGPWSFTTCKKVACY